MFCSQGQSFIAVVSVHTPIRQLLATAPNVSRSVHSMEDHLREPPATHRGLLLSHDRWHELALGPEPYHHLAARERGSSRARSRD
jgi:hypothetical protein